MFKKKYNVRENGNFSGNHHCVSNKELMKKSVDLFYLKNKSFLEIAIALKISPNV